MTDYLKIPEVARRLDVSEPTVRRMVKGGKLPSVFVGGAYRVSEEDLANYLEAARVEPGDGSPKAQAPLPPEDPGAGQGEREQLFMYPASTRVEVRAGAPALTLIYKIKEAAERAERGDIPLGEALDTIDKTAAQLRRLTA